MTPLTEVSFNRTVQSSPVLVVQTNNNSFLSGAALTCIHSLFLRRSCSLRSFPREEEEEEAKNRDFEVTERLEKRHLFLTTSSESLLYIPKVERKLRYIVVFEPTGPLSNATLPGWILTKQNP